MKKKRNIKQQKLMDYKVRKFCNWINEILRENHTCLRKNICKSLEKRVEGRERGRDRERERRETDFEDTGASWQKEVKGTHLASHHHLIQCVHAVQYTVVSAIPLCCSLIQMAAVPWPHTQTCSPLLTLQRKYGNSRF